MALANIYKNIFGKAKLVTPLQLKNFIAITDVEENSWNNKPNNTFKTKFYDGLVWDDKLQPKFAGYISYRPVVGQVGIFVLEEEYRNRGLGKQILQQTINQMKEHNATHIWAVTVKENIFWSNVWGKRFIWHEAGQLHPSVTGFGYKMKI